MKQKIKNFFYGSKIIQAAATGLAVAATTVFANAEGALTSAALTSAATNITAEITAALPIAGGVMATIIGIKVAVRFFKSLAK